MQFSGAGPFTMSGNRLNFPFPKPSPHPKQRLYPFSNSSLFRPLLAPGALSSSSMDFPLPDVHAHGLIQYLSLWVWLTSLSMFSRSACIFLARGCAGCWASSRLRWNSPLLMVVSTFSRDQPFPGVYSSHGGSWPPRRPRCAKQAHLRPLFWVHPSKFQWANQATWPSSASTGQGNILGPQQERRRARAREGVKR